MNWLDQVCQTCQGHTAQRGSSLAAQSEFSGNNWSNKESSDPKTASEQPALDLEDRSLASPKPSTTSSNGVSLGQKQDWYIFAEFSQNFRMCLGITQLTTHRPLLGFEPRIIQGFAKLTT